MLRYQRQHETGSNQLMRVVDRVKKARLQTLGIEFESIQKKEIQMIMEYHTKVMIVANQLRWSNKEIEDVHVMEKILWILNTKFEIIATTIKATKNLETMTI